MHYKKAFPWGKVAWAKPMTDEGDHGGAESLSHGLRPCQLPLTREPDDA